MPKRYCSAVLIVNLPLILPFWFRFDAVQNHHSSRPCLPLFTLNIENSDPRFAARRCSMVNFGHSLSTIFFSSLYSPVPLPLRLAFLPSLYPPFPPSPSLPCSPASSIHHSCFPPFPFPPTLLPFIKNSVRVIKLISRL